MLLYEQSRRLTPSIIALAIVFPLVVAGGFLWRAARDGGVELTLASGLYGLGLTLVPLATLLAVGWLVPTGAWLKTVRVDETGLAVSRWRIPAGRIGWVELIPAEVARNEVISIHEYNGVELSRWRRFNDVFGRHDAVLVEELGAKRPGWVIGSTRPQELADALIQVRDGQPTVTGPAGDIGRSGDHEST